MGSQGFANNSKSGQSIRPPASTTALMVFSVAALLVVTCHHPSKGQERPLCSRTTMGVIVTYIRGDKRHFSPAVSVVLRLQFMRLL